MEFNYSAFSEIPRKGNYSHHFFIDVETTETGAALIVRGEDHRFFPRAGAALLWNFRDASAREFIVAKGTVDEMLAIHDAIVSIYESGDPARLAELAAVPGGLEVYAIISPFSPVTDFAKGNGARRRCASYETRNLYRARGTKPGAAAGGPSDEALAEMIEKARAE